MLREHQGETVKPYAVAFYKSKAWKTCRAAYMSKVGGLCEDCLAAGRFTPAEIVHHVQEITPENMAGEIRTLPNTEDVTQAEYDGMASHDAGTYYFIVG